MQLRIDSPTTDRIDSIVAYTIDYRPYVAPDITKAQVTLGQITKSLITATSVTKTLSPATQITT